MPGSIGPMEIILVLAIALIVLGPKKLPEVGRSLGKGIAEFQESINGDDEDERLPHSTETSATTEAPKP